MANLLNEDRRPGWMVAAATAFATALVVCGPSASAADGDPLWASGGVFIDKAVSPKTFDAHEVVADGAGGSIVVWKFVTDLNPTTYSAQIKARRLDAGGKAMWTTIVSFMATHMAMRVAPDGAGGVLVAMAQGQMSAAGYTIYAQRVTHTGARPWGNIGVAVSNAFGAYSSFPLAATPKVCDDGVGGAFVGWNDRLARVRPDGKVDSPGVDGIQLAPGAAAGFALVADGTIAVGAGLGKGSTLKGLTRVPSGAFAAWSTPSGEIFAQRVQAGLAWGPSGVQVGKHDAIGGFELVRDGARGVIVAWIGNDSAQKRTRILAQRLDSQGGAMWGAGGAVLFDSAAVGVANWPSVAGSLIATLDGAGGAIAAWSDYRSATTGDVYSNRVDALGKPLWTANGEHLTPFLPGQTQPASIGEPRIAADGKGGAVIVFADKRAWSWDITATRRDAQGKNLFSKGVHFDSYSPANQGLDQTTPEIALDIVRAKPPGGGAIVVWKETAGSTRKLFAQKIRIDWLKE